jgi:hypothetical protein
MELQGRASSLTIRERSITITRKVRAFSPPLQKDIPIQKITAITFQRAGLFSPGYITFSLIGGTEPRSGALSAAMNDNAVLFTRKQEKEFLQAKEYLERLIAVS